MPTTTEEKTVDFSNVRVSSTEVLKGAVAVFSIVLTLVSGVWFLSSKLSAMQVQIDSLQHDVTEIKHTISPTHSWSAEPSALTQKAPLQQDAGGPVSVHY